MGNINGLLDAPLIIDCPNSDSRVLQCFGAAGFGAASHYVALHIHSPWGSKSLNNSRDMHAKFENING